MTFLILVDFDKNFTKKGENVLQKVAENERRINYNNMFLK